jgi:hypothetical protein
MRPADLRDRIISLQVGAPRTSTLRICLEQSILVTLVVMVWGILLYEALLAVH